ncbi:MAG: hypothetical protein A2020_12950 [Lentisphaerae bacterium GWF2_45_14]|nr:MAG: hypothetical protein A2020_12950 [Lentisphaerae bacterium GWF2_45_14]
MTRTYTQNIYTAPIDADAENPGLFIKCVGDFKSLGNFYFEQVASHVSFHLITAGSGIFDADGKKYAAEAGDLFIFSPGMYVKYYDNPSAPWCYMWFVLSGSDIGWAFEKTGIKKRLPFIPVLSVEFQNFTRTLLSEFEKGDFSCMYPVNSAWECIRLLQKSISTEKEGNKKPDVALLCKSIIDSQKENFISVDELAEKLKVDRATIFRSFKKDYGVSPKDYIDSVRIEKACRLLKQSSSPIKEIAWLAGFSGHDYFSAVFRKKFGISPSEWRKLN